MFRRASITLTPVLTSFFSIAAFVGVLWFAMQGNDQSTTNTNTTTNIDISANTNISDVNDDRTLVTNSSVNTNTVTNPTIELKELNEDRLVKIKYPPAYTLEKKQEENRRGSFASYDIRSSSDSTPAMDELQLFSRESVQTFNTRCQDTLCFEGDYPTVERFDGLQAAFEARRDYQEYDFIRLGSENYLVKNIDIMTDAGILREYNAFVGTTMVTLWVYMVDANENQEADLLVEPWVLEYSGF